MRGKNATGQDKLPFFQSNPNLAPDLVLLDVDNINEITYLREIVKDKINPNLLDKVENAFVAYVVRYNVSNAPGASQACGPFGGKGVVSSGEMGPPELPPNSVNAIIPELSIGIPLPNRSVEATTPPTISELCSQQLAAAEKLCNIAPVFEIPNDFSATIRAGNFVVVSLYDKKFPSRGGTVLDVVKNKSGEVLMHSLASRSDASIRNLGKCDESPAAGQNATGDSPHPPTGIQPGGKVESYPGLVIVKKYGLLDHYRKRRSRPLPQSIVFHWTGAPATWQGTVSALNSRKVSTHYEVDRNGIVYEYLDPSEFIAWHAGKKNNTLSIGVDLSHNPRVKKNRWPEKQLKAAKMLTAYLCKRFSITPSVAPPRCGPPKNAKGWPTGLSRESDCERSKKKVPRLIEGGYTLLRHSNCSSTICPGDFPIQDMVPTAAEIAAIAVGDETVAPEDACATNAPGANNARKQPNETRPLGAGGQVL